MLPFMNFNMSISKNLKHIKKQLPNHVALVAVSKTKPVSDIMEAYHAGQRVFGENKIQEMVDKHEQMPNDIEWHMIGHVQRNKIKYMSSFVNLIHGVDSIKLLLEINKQAEKHKRVINCLLQIKIASEDSKFGMSQETAKEILTSEQFSILKNVKVVGLMGMATFTNDTEQIKNEFKFLKTTFNKAQIYHPDLKIVSMGMSGDYNLAIASGSTMVRIGSSIFGSRN